MDVFLIQNIVDGLSRGALYGVFAMGFTLIFGVLDILNLAHAATFMWCAFAGWLVMAEAGLPLPVGLAAAMAAGAAIALALELVAFRPLRREGAGGRAGTGAGGGKLSPMISSIGASIILVSIAEAVFGVQTRRFPDRVLDPKPFLIGGPGGLRISRAQILILVASVVLMAVLGFFIRKTRMGKAIRAIAASRKASLLLGIDVNSIIVVTFLIGGALAGAAGILVALLTNNIVPGMGAQIELRGLAVVILGGMGDIEGAVLGGFLLGLVETFTIAYLPGGSDIKDAIAFLILFFILLVRPNGILGRGKAERAESAERPPSGERRQSGPARCRRKRLPMPRPSSSSPPMRTLPPQSPGPRPPPHKRDAGLEAPSPPFTRGYCLSRAPGSPLSEPTPRPFWRSSWACPYSCPYRQRSCSAARSRWSSGFPCSDSPTSTSRSAPSASAR